MSNLPPEPGEVDDLSHGIDESFGSSLTPPEKDEDWPTEVNGE